MAIFNSGYNEYSKKVDYSNIKNLEDLRRAQLELKYKINQKEMEITNRVSSLKIYLNPITYINYATTKFETLEQVISYCIRGYNSAKNFICKYKNTHSAKEEVNNTPDRETEFDNSTNNKKE